jgi:Ca-activated chloride channel family protein
MRFYSPLYLILLPLVIVLYIVGRQGIKSFLDRRDRYINRESFLKLKLADNTPELNTSLFLSVLIFFLIIISLARPLGPARNKEFESSGRDIVIALDISDSMKANDVNLSGSYAESIQAGGLFGISRFEGAKKIIRNFVRQLENDRVSLVAFSGSAFPLSPLTNDYDIFLSFLNNLDFSYSESGSTNIGEAIEVAARRFKSGEKSDTKILIIISDGEDQNQGTIQKAMDAKRKNIIINTIGIGSVKGSRILIGKDFYGNEIYKKYQGQDVITSLNDKALKEIAEATGGKYFQVNDQDISRELYNQVRKVKPNNFKRVNTVEYQELFQLFLFAGIFLLTIETALPLLLKTFLKTRPENN